MPTTDQVLALSPKVIAPKPLPAQAVNTSAFSKKNSTDAMEAFKNVRVRHPMLQTLLGDLQMHVDTPGTENVLVLTGAAGAGKTAASKALVRSLLHEYRDESESDPGDVPVIWVEARQNGDVKQGFKSLFKAMLKQLHEHDAESGPTITRADGHLWLNPQGRQTADGLRSLLESALKHRRTKACVIDEASHLLTLARSASVMDTLKSLANTTDCKVVLVGSFDLLDLIIESGQVSRRTSILALERYKDTPSDREAFRYVVQRLQEAWPCEVVPPFTAVSDDLREVTFGLVGLLKTVLTSALALQLRNKGVWDSSFLQKAAKAGMLRDSIRREMEQGEAKLKSAAFGSGAWSPDAFAAMVRKMEG